MITLHIKCDTDKEMQFAQEVSQDLLVVFEDAKILITRNGNIKCDNGITSLTNQTEMELN